MHNDVFPQVVSASCNHSKHRVQRHLAENVVLIATVFKTNNNYYETLTIYECVEK